MVDRIRDGILSSELPATINDAVSICVKLSVAHLCVDSLCIAQDDDEEKMIEIAKMPYIYGNASFTIAAARSRTVLDGFLGQRDLGPPSSAFKLRCRSLDDRIGTLTICQVRTPAEPLDGRAWTFQERLLSRKIIDFGTRCTRWSRHRPDGEYESYSDGWRALSEETSISAQTLQVVDLDPYQAISSRERLRIRLEPLARCGRSIYRPEGVAANRQMSSKCWCRGDLC